jgi:hypothetical protein
VALYLPVPQGQGIPLSDLRTYPLHPLHHQPHYTLFTASTIAYESHDVRWYECTAHTQAKKSLLQEGKGASGAGGKVTLDAQNAEAPSSASATGCC